METRSTIDRPDEPVQRKDGGSDDLRARVHGMWAAVAPGWAEHAQDVDARVAHVTERMIDLAMPEAVDRVLELACGPGGAGLAVAQRLAPNGEVVLSDVADEMTSVAAARAAALGLSNVRTRQLDLERIEEPDASYDVILCREGLMFATDPAGAAREISRVLRPGGRVALTTWGPRERNPWLGLLIGAVKAQTGAPAPHAAGGSGASCANSGIPGAFSLADSEQLAHLLSDAGLADVVVSELPVPLRAGSFEEWWTRSCALAAPLARVVASLSDDAVQAIRDRAQEAAHAYETPSGLEFPGLTLLASARRA
jgi:ubiquinone/menaquinone biosynthesis C-methylase UbiE